MSTVTLEGWSAWKSLYTTKLTFSNKSIMVQWHCPISLWEESSFDSSSPTCYKHRKHKQTYNFLIAKMGAKDRTRVKTKKNNKTNQERNDMSHI